MRTFASVLTLAALLSAGFVSAAESTRVIIRTVGDVPGALSERMVWWLTDAIGPATNAGALPVRLLTASGVSKAAHSVAEKGAVVLVLAEGLKDEPRLFWNEPGLAVVNVSALRPAGAATDASRELLARRVEKVSVHGTAAALGMSDCVFLYCALYRAQNFEELDKQARGLCPPCMEKLGKLGK